MGYYDGHKKRVRSLSAVNKNPRDMLFDHIMNDIKRFTYLDQRDLKFVLRMALHKVEENNNGGGINE